MAEKVSSGDEVPIHKYDFLHGNELNCCSFKTLVDYEEAKTLDRLRTERDELFNDFRESCVEAWDCARESNDKSDRTEIDGQPVINDLEQKKSAIFEMKDKLDEAHLEMMQSFHKLQAKLHEKGVSDVYTCTCYRSFWIPKSGKQSLQLDTLKVFDETQVYTGAGNVKSFKEASTDYMQVNFRKDGVFKIPAVPVVEDSFRFCRRKRKESKSIEAQYLHLQTDEEIKALEELTINESNELLSRRRGALTVEKLACGIYEWADKAGMNSFIFLNYEYQNYLGNLQIDSNVTKNIGDHDLFCIVEGIGIIFFQVKSVSSNAFKTISNKMKDALNQIIKDKFVFQESNRDLDFVKALPLYGFVALPCIRLESDILKDFIICENHRSITLCMNSLENKGIGKWLDERLQTFPSFHWDNYHLLCGRYVGLASIVNIPTLADGIEKTGQKLSLAFLTPQQKKVVDAENRFQILVGDYGTGKSLVLVAKARKLAEENPECHVHVITCADIFSDGVLYWSNRACLIAKQLRKFVHAKGTIENITVSTYANVLYAVCKEYPVNITEQIFLESIAKLLAQYNSNIPVHILLEEMTVILFVEYPGLINGLCSLIRDDSCMWLSIAASTYYLERSSICSFLDTLKPKLEDFIWTRLLKIMRIPKNLYNMIKFIDDYTKRGGNKLSECGHVIEGPMPLLYYVPNCICNPAPETDCFSCDCITDRMVATISDIMSTIGSISRDKITFMVVYYFEEAFLYRRIRKFLESAFQKMGIAYKWFSRWSEPYISGDKGPYISVVNEVAYIGCENNVVIGIDTFGFNQFYPQNQAGLGSWETLPLTRCVGQYIHVMWNIDEVRSLILKEIQKAKQIVMKTYSKEQKDEWKNKRLAWMDEDSKMVGECEKLLIKEGLVVVHKVKYPREET